MSETMQLHPEVMSGVLACILWAFVGLMGVLTASPVEVRTGPPIPTRTLRFRVGNAQADYQWAHDVAGLAAVLQRQRIGEAVEIYDLVRNRVDTVSVSADGSVWEFYGSRHVFTLDDRYTDNPAEGG